MPVHRRADRVVRPYEENAVVYRKWPHDALFASTVRRGEVTPPYVPFTDTLPYAPPPIRSTLNTPPPLPSKK